MVTVVAKAENRAGEGRCGVTGTVAVKSAMSNLGSNKLVSTYYSTLRQPFRGGVVLGWQNSHITVTPHYPPSNHTAALGF